LELSGDDAVNADDAVRAPEDIAHLLRLHPQSCQQFAMRSKSSQPRSGLDLPEPTC
jgi:hypothetical protein